MPELEPSASPRRTPEASGAVGLARPPASARLSGRRLLRRFGLAAAIALLSACVPGAGISDDLPDASLAKAPPGCQIASIAPAVVLPESDPNASGSGWRVAILRFEAVCVPDAGTPAPWWQPYRISFQQRFSKPTKASDTPQAWFGGETQHVSDLDHPSRPVDAATEAMGQNCALLLDRIESETLPCVRAKDPLSAVRLRDALRRYRDESRFTININGENDLNAVRLSRDAGCLSHWRQVQGLMDTPLQVCASN